MKAFSLYLFLFIYNSFFTTALNETVDINGLVDISLLEQIQNPLVINKLGDKRAYLNSINLELTQVYPYKNDTSSFDETYYSFSEKLSNSKGEFTFSNVPLDLSSNMSYFVINSRSKHFNLSPNRILVSINNTDTSIAKYQANFIGKDNFPALDILYPETLPLMSNLTIKLLSENPIREYVITRNDNILANGFLGSIFESKWKTALFVTAIFMMIFPYIIGYIDPETAAEMKRRKKN